MTRCCTVPTGYPSLLTTVHKSAGLNSHMRCLCYQECRCGFPEIIIDPDIETFAQDVRRNETNRVNNRLRLLGDVVIPAITLQNIGQGKPTGLRYLLWELIKILGPMDWIPPVEQLRRVSAVHVAYLREILAEFFE